MHCQNGCGDEQIGILKAKWQRSVQVIYSCNNDTRQDFFQRGRINCGTFSADQRFTIYDNEHSPNSKRLVTACDAVDQYFTLMSIYCILGCACPANCRETCVLVYSHVARWLIISTTRKMCVFTDDGYTYWGRAKDDHIVFTIYNDPDAISSDVINLYNGSIILCNGGEKDFADWSLCVTDGQNRDIFKAIYKYIGNARISKCVDKGKKLHHV